MRLRQALAVEFLKAQTYRSLSEEHGSPCGHIPACDSDGDSGLNSKPLSGRLCTAGTVESGSTGL
jgi:hypothetical protein